MPKRTNLPYTTQDLFPQTAATPSSATSTRASNAANGVNGGGTSTRAGSIISTPSSIYYPRPTLHHHGKSSPLSSSYNTQTFGSASSIFSRNRFKTIRKLVKRLFKPSTLDFETAIWEIFHLIINPRKMYRSHYYYRQQQQLQQQQQLLLLQLQPQVLYAEDMVGNAGRNSYTRDDPSFLILITGFLCISAVAWGVVYLPNLLDIFKLITYMVFIDFYLFGIIISTVTWVVTNRLFNLEMGKGTPGGFSRYSVNYIEWGFCFDIHCNSFLIIWCLLYVVQFVLLPIIRIKKSIVALILGNSLYFGSIGYYFIVSFYGFNSLPIITSSIIKLNHKNPARVLQLIVVAGILPFLALTWLLTIVLRFNVADKMVDLYFN
ncbi:unc-50 family protein [Acetobacter pasteurianus]|nr:unc-50 family protein [Acetobacter pasteurianus]